MSRTACAVPPTMEAARSAEERANLHGLLAAIFRAPVDRAMLSAFRGRELRGALRQAGVVLEAELDPAREGEVLDGLAIDFTQLFHGPGERIHPYESLHVGRPEDRELIGEVSREVRRAYEAAGVDLADRHSTPPDFIATELEFMAELARRESLAWQENDAAEAGRQRACAGAFLRAHLGVLAAPFAEQVAVRAETGFYRQFAGLLTAFLASEMTELADDGAAQE